MTGRPQPSRYLHCGLYEHTNSPDSYDTTATALKGSDSAAQADLELVKVDAALNNGLCSPAGLHEGDDEGRREEVQALVGGLDPEGSTAHKGQDAEPAVPVHQLTRPWRCDDVCDGLGEEHAPGTCMQCALAGHNVAEIYMEKEHTPCTCIQCVLSVTKSMNRIANVGEESAPCTCLQRVLSSDDV